MSENNPKVDIVSLGELLIRFDPGDARIHTARNFFVWGGGAEFNVAANLSQVFRKRAGFVTAFGDNAVGRLAEGFARQYSVDTDNVLWRENERNGLYFIDRGHGARGPRSAFDRDRSAASKLSAGDIKWKSVFANGVRWFHTSGVFAGLSETTPELVIEAMVAAKAAGATVSYDLNYRDSLWSERGGRDAANELNRRILPFVDVVFGIFDLETDLSKFDLAHFSEKAGRLCSEFPNLSTAVASLRHIHSSSRHDFGAVCLSDGQVITSHFYKNVDVLDRVGSGDAFASGFINGLLDEKGVQFALDCGVCHGILSMTTPGDVSMATAEEVYALMNGESAMAIR